MWVGWSKLRWISMLEILLVNFLMDLGWKKRQSTFPEGICKVAGPLSGVSIFSC